MAVLLTGTGCGRLSAPGSSSSAETSSGGGLGSSSFQPHPAIGLVSAVPDRDSIVAIWRVDGLEGSLPDVGLFVGTIRATLFDGDPVRVDSQAGSVTLAGLDPDIRHFVGLAVEDEDGDWVQSGPVLRAHTGAPIYCDASSSAPSPDGMTPASAFPSLQLAVIEAFLAGGGNIWIATGTYPDQRINLPSTIHLYGGFASGFAGAERDPSIWPTRLTGRPSAPLIAFLPGDERTIVDGLTLDGMGISSTGVEVDGAEVELRLIEARRCGFGGKFQSSPGDDVLRQKLVACSFNDNLTEGLTMQGSFDFLVEACSFRNNSQEGLDAGPLVAPDGGEAGITVRDCFFSGNGAEGLDIDLDAPLAGGVSGGQFEICLEDSSFETNVGSGFLIDLDYEQAPLWRARILVRGCEARANGLHGGMIDFDAAADVLVDRMRSSANRGDGLLITSESHSDTAIVSASAFLGNGGFGTRLSLGFVGACIGHCVFAGNEAGGALSQVVGSLCHSSVFYEQAAAVSGVTSWKSVDVSSAAGATFLNAPDVYSSVESIQGSLLNLSTQPLLSVGSVAEVLDDRVARTVTGVSASGIVVDPAVEALLPPFAVSVYSAIAGTVDDDFRLSGGSDARDAGMAPPFGAPVDAGIFGAPSPGIPGQLPLLPPDPFLILERATGWQVAIGPAEDFEVRAFGGVPDSGSFPASIFVIEPGGTGSVVSVTGSGAQILVHPPSGGWIDGSVVEIHRGLTSVDGRELTVPVAFPLRVQGGN